MKELTRITDADWTYGCYPRGDYARDVIYGFYRHRDIELQASLTGASLTDGRGQAMLKAGLIDRKQYEALIRGELMLFADFRRLDPFPCEELYAQFESVRLSVLGQKALTRCHALSLENSAPPREDDMLLDERAARDQLLTGRKALYFALLEPKLLAAMRRDLLLAASHGAELIVLTGDRPGIGIPTRELLQPFLKDIPDLAFLTLPYGRSAFDLAAFPGPVPADAALFLYGEEGFLAARHLSIDAFACGTPRGYFAGAVTGCLARPRYCAAYIPAHRDVIPFVPLTGRTRATLRMLSLARKALGPEADLLAIDEIMRRAPQIFLDPFSEALDCPQAASDFPIRIKKAALRDFAAFDWQREEAILQYLNSVPGLSCRSLWFDDSYAPHPVPWEATGPRDGILVHAARVEKADAARVTAFPAGRTVRETLRTLPGSLSLVSNFLFFFTPRLADLYNRLRQDRPKEQLRSAGGHLDYLLENENGARRESFPLYRKSVLAYKDDGRFLFVNFRLGGGEAALGGYALRWEREDVDCAENARPLIVFTPHLSRADEQADGKTYLRTVGKDRLNFVIVQDEIMFARLGDVALPSIGVVLSLSPEAGAPFLSALRLSPDSEGYIDTAALSFSLRLDPPAGVSPAEWKKVKWAYGGGLTLMLNGRSVYGPGDPTDDLSEEGWLTPLSRQTQESELHTLARHPRTAVGVAENGDLILMVFSGRTSLSRGADYKEMCHIAKTLFPDVRSLMNVDGGGSSVLGLTVNGQFLELSLPSTSSGSVVGMVRPINTALCVGMR